MAIASKPVFADDVISYRCTVTATREMASRPKWGLMFSTGEGFNQRGELVFSFDGKVLMAERAEWRNLDASALWFKARLDIYIFRACQRGPAAIQRPRPARRPRIC